MRCERLIIDGVAARTPGFTHHRVTGYWEPVAHDQLRAGDIFRRFQPNGAPDFVIDGVHQAFVMVADGLGNLRSVPVRGVTV